MIEEYFASEQEARIAAKRLREHGYVCRISKRRMMFGGEQCYMWIVLHSDSVKARQIVDSAVAKMWG